MCRPKYPVILTGYFYPHYDAGVYIDKNKKTLYTKRVIDASVEREGRPN